MPPLFYFFSKVVLTFKTPSGIIATANETIEKEQMMAIKSVAMVCSIDTNSKGRF